MTEINAITIQNLNDLQFISSVQVLAQELVQVLE